MRFLRSLKRWAQPGFDAPVRPDRPFFAVGDIHGGLEPLERLLDRLDAIVETEPVICVGDYVDRGPQSAAVVERLYDLTQAHPDRFVCLRGNHEDMLLSFLDDPDDAGPRWLRHGGLQTLESYRVTLPDGSMAAARDSLAERIGETRIDWLRTLPTVWRSGNVAVTHAGADPSRPVETQDAANRVWGHPDFLTRTRDDGVWVVYGHVVVAEAHSTAGRIAIDTGAYATGRLTAARIDQTGVRFLASDGSDAR